MVWQTIPTFTAGNVLTAAQVALLGGNLNETAVAKATTAGRIFASTGANTLAQRTPTTAYLATTESSSSTTFTNLATAGPDAIVTTGPLALILLTTGMYNNTVNAEAFYGVACSGATTFVGNDNESLRHTSATASAMMVGTWSYIMPLTAGSNSFRARYKVSSGTGTWFDRRISVLPF